MILELICAIIIIVLAFIGGIFSIRVTTRSEGSFRKAIICLFVSITIFGLKGVLALTHTLGITNFYGEYSLIQHLASLSILIFMVTTVLKLRQMMEKINHNHIKKKR